MSGEDGVGYAIVVVLLAAVAIGFTFTECQKEQRVGAADGGPPCYLMARAS